MKKQASPTKSPQTSTITLRGSGSVLLLTALRRADGSATTFAITKGADNKSMRGMTETHADMDAAKVHLGKLAEQATKLGWQRRAWVPTTKPDAFSKLPMPPKAGTTR